MHLARVGLDHHILEDRAEPDRAEDLGLRVGLQADALGVAAALDVEDAVVAPAVLVVADERPVRLRRERCLAGAAEAEEERHVAVVADVAAAVQREHAALRHQVVQVAARVGRAGVLGCWGRRGRCDLS